MSEKYCKDCKHRTTVGWESFCTKHLNYIGHPLPCVDVRASLSACSPEAVDFEPKESVVEEPEKYKESWEEKGFKFMLVVIMFLIGSLVTCIARDIWSSTL